MNREELEGKGRSVNGVNTVLACEILKNLIKNHFALKIPHSLVFLNGLERFLSG